MNANQKANVPGTFVPPSRSQSRLVPGIVCLLIIPSFACPPKTYTTVAEWNAGQLFNTIGVADAADGQLQLVDPGQIRTFPTLWPANAGEDTLTKFDTNLNKEVGRYRTWFLSAAHNEFTGPAPSRTSVDGSGNVYVVNRHFDGKVVSVLKILTSDAGAVDRNGNGVIDTAVDSNNNGLVTGAEILAAIDDGGPAGTVGGIAGDGIPQIAEFRDERIKWFKQIPGSAGHLGRSCALDPSGNLWVGGYSPGNYWKLDSATGAILAGPVPTPSLTPYGAVVDSAGMLWSAGLSTAMGQLNTNTATYVTTRFGRDNYGIALDDSRTRVYLGRGNPYGVFDTTALAFSFPAATGTNSYGISTAGNGDILVHGRVGFGFAGGVTRYRATDHSVVWSAAAQATATGGSARGVAPDANGDVFTINLDTNNVSKFRGSDGAPLGVFPIGSRPYSYSDLSGSSFLQTNLIGTWTNEHSDLLRGNKNCVVSWASTGPGVVKVEIAGSGSPGAPGAFSEAANGVIVPAGAGKYITIRVTLQADNQISPAVQNLTLKSCPEIGDFDGNCCVDMADYNLMRAAYLTPRSTDPKWDVNGDGVFNVVDLRREVVLFCSSGGTACP